MFVEIYQRADRLRRKRRSLKQGGQPASGKDIPKIFSLFNHSGDSPVYAGGYVVFDGNGMLGESEKQKQHTYKDFRTGAYTDSKTEGEFQFNGTNIVAGSGSNSGELVINASDAFFNLWNEEGAKNLGFTSVNKSPITILAGNSETSNFGLFTQKRWIVLTPEGGAMKIEATR